MAVKITNNKIVKRWNSIMNDICLEHLTIGEYCSELEVMKNYYGVSNGITIKWLRNEVDYWLSCYYESGNCRCDDRFLGENEYKTWLSETGKLKRLKNLLYKYPKTDYVAVWVGED